MSMLSLIMFDAGAVFSSYIPTRTSSVEDTNWQKNIHEILYAVQNIYIVSWHYSYPFCYLGIVKIMNDFLQKAIL